jgi:pyruvate/2-oxoglutarate dehydrogenase complex dihydrolipoamide dehydrogenase (E3) component
MVESFDVIVIGGGPGGYVCAIRAAQLSLKVACVENRGSLGGACLNVGCIPSKALLQSSHLFEEANHAFAGHGIKLAKVELDLPTMMSRKDEVVKQNTAGIEFLFKKNKVTYIKGTGRISKVAQGAHEVTVKDLGMKFKLGFKVVKADAGKNGVSLTLEPAKGGAAETLTADIALVSIGRRPYTAGLGLAEAGVKMSTRGFVEADENFQTNIEGIFAIGDVIGGLMLAHKAEDEGMACAEIMAGPERTHQLRRHRRRGLHMAGSGRHRQDRRAAERSRRFLQFRQIPLHRQ